MNKSDITRDYFMLQGPLAKKGYDWWWHSFTAYHSRTGQPKTFYIEYFLCNPALAQEEPVIVWNDPEGRKAGKRPSYCMVNVGFWGSDFTSPWVWLSSSNLVSSLTGKRLENSVFEVGGGRPKVFGLARDCGTAEMVLER